MTNTPKLWKDMTDAEKGALLLAWHEEDVIEYFSCRNFWREAEVRIGKPDLAYRIKPKAPKVETVTGKVFIWSRSDPYFIGVVYEPLESFKPKIEETEQ